MKKRYGIQSIFVKQIIGFSFGVLCIAAITTGILFGAVKIAQNEVYERMRAQSEYYLKSLDTQLSNIYTLQVNFFYDRRIVLLMQEESILGGYELRDALLSLQERLQSIQGCSDMIEDIHLFIPKAEYFLTPSSVGRMREEEWKLLDQYLVKEKSGFYRDEDSFFFLEMNSMFTSDEYPSHVISIVLSRERIENNLKALAQADSSGAFFWQDGEVILQTDEETGSLGKRIMPLLRTDENGEYMTMQRIQDGGEYYLVCVSRSELLGTFVQYSEEKAVMTGIDRLRGMIFMAWLIMVVIAVFFIVYTQYLIHRPIERLLHAFERVKTGNLKEHIHHNRKNEFAYIYDGFNEMEDRVGELIDEVAVQSRLAQKAELKQLQSQINPHFLYNSLFALKSRMHREEYESAEEMAELLGKYFRFLTRTGEDFVKLEQEAEHAWCYAAIQASRFSQRIRVDFGKIPSEAARIKVPRLILQPLLENALEHGLEEKESGGLLRVVFEVEEENLKIRVEDNGDNASEEKIAFMKRMLEEGVDPDGEITGMINIHRRLCLWSGGKAGLETGRSSLGGVCITVYVKGVIKNGSSADC